MLIIQRDVPLMQIVSRLPVCKPLLQGEISQSILGWLEQRVLWVCAVWWNRPMRASDDRRVAISCNVFPDLIAN